MKALLIVAHGSRRKESNEEVHRLATRIRETAGPAFDLVDSAFLEIADPLFDSAAAGLIEQGAAKIKVFPYFLTAGIHVVNDIPKLIEEAEKKHPGIEFEVLPHLSGLPGLAALILNQIYKGAPRNPSLASLETD